MFPAPEACGFASSNSRKTRRSGAIPPGSTGSDEPTLRDRKASYSRVNLDSKGLDLVKVEAIHWYDMPERQRHRQSTKGFKGNGTPPLSPLIAAAIEPGSLRPKRRVPSPPAKPSPSVGARRCHGFPPSRRSRAVRQWSGAQSLLSGQFQLTPGTYWLGPEQR